jgi:hypothetical protein
LVVTEFYKNNTYPYSEGGVSYALLIGKSNDIKLPKIISVLAIRDNNQYKLGEIVTVLPQEGLLKEGSRSLLYFTKDTIINKIKSTIIIGSEYPAVLGKIKR